MAELSDSTRRLIIFVAIVLGGSVLLIFDIPVLYLMMVVVGIAVVLLVITGTIILTDVIRNLIYKLKTRPKKPKKEKRPKEKKLKEGRMSSLSGKFSLPSISLPQIKIPARPVKEKEKSKKAKENKKVKGTELPSDAMDEPLEDIGEFQENEVTSSGFDNNDSSFDDNNLLEGLDLDDSLDIDAELDAVTPEFDNVRTPFGDENALDSLPSVKDVKNMDITTSDEEERITIDSDQGEDEINEIYSSSIDVGSDSGGEMISGMEGGDTISSSDLSLYSSSDDSPYMYGQEEESGGEEQFELSQIKGGGDDDLIASLKADIEDLKKRDDDVLLRDLKDVHVTAEEISEELKEIMNIINRKVKRR